MQNLEDALSFRHEAEDVKRTASTYEASAGVGTDGFHLAIPLRLSKELFEGVVLSWQRDTNCAVTYVDSLVPVVESSSSER